MPTHFGFTLCNANSLIVTPEIPLLEQVKSQVAGCKPGAWCAVSGVLRVVTA